VLVKNQTIIAYLAKLIKTKGKVDEAKEWKNKA